MFFKKVYINNKENFLKGMGAGYFLNYIEQNKPFNVEIVDSIEDSDIALLAVQTQFYNNIKSSTKVILRLDGLDKNYIEQNRMAYNRANKIIYQTNFSKEMYNKAFPTRDIPYTIIPNGHYINEFTHKFGPEDKIRVLSVGTWADVPAYLPYYEGTPKATDLVKDLLGCAPKIFEMFPKLEWRIAGEYLPQSFVDLMKKYPNNLIYLGRQSRSDLFMELMSAHFLYHPGRNDNCPNVVVESITSQLPVIYYKSGGVPDLVKDAGIAVDPDSKEEIIDAFKNLIQNYTNYQKLAILRAVDLDIKKIAKLYWNFILN